MSHAHILFYTVTQSYYYTVFNIPLLGSCCIDTVLLHRYGVCYQAHYCVILTFMRLHASLNFHKGTVLACYTSTVPVFG